MHSYSCSLFLLLCISKFLPAELNSLHGNNERFLGRYPYQKVTPSPIDISRRKAHNVTLTPVELRGILNDKLKVINTGQSVEVIIEQEETDSAITGGPLSNDKYQFKKSRFYWINDINGVAGVTVDGKDGAPLESVGYFYNKKYKSFTNATKHRDGLAVISFRIKICENDNPLFPPFAESLKKVRQAGSSTSITLGRAFKWYSAFPPQTSYFAYPAAYTNESTRQQYYCTTAIVLPHYPNMCLSKRQFQETFLSLKNKAGGPLTNKAQQFSRTQPVVQSTKVIQYLVPGVGGSTQEHPKVQQESMQSENPQEESGNQNEKQLENQTEKSENQNQSEKEKNVQQNETQSENQLPNEPEKQNKIQQSPSASQI